MTFGDCFKPYVARLATCWNELEFNRLKKLKLKGFFGYNLKRTRVSLGNLVFLKVDNFGYKCQMIIRILPANIILLEVFWLSTIFTREI
jgi:hypothetical protein